MERITICAEHYAWELFDFYYADEKEHVLMAKHPDDRCRLFFFDIPAPFFNAPLMMELMQGIILEDNAVVRGSAALSERLRTMLFEADFKAQSEILQQVAQSTGYLNVDGYIRFRLRHYTDTLNDALYTVVRKNLCML